MPKPRRENRIKTTTLTGEGPNGEDIVQFVDTETGAVIKEEVRRNDSRVVVTTDEDGAPVVEDKKAPPKVMSAAEMMRLAIREKELTFGTKVQELLAEIMDGCKEVILEGTYSHTIPMMAGLTADMVKQAVKDLKNLGYKVKLEVDPGSMGIMTVKWPLKEDKVAKTRRKKVMEVGEPEAIEVAPAVKDKKVGKRREPKIMEAEQSVSPSLSLEFKGVKEKPPGWRPPRRIPAPRGDD